MKVITILKRAMRLIGAIGVGEQLTSEETSDCIIALNQLIESWNLNALMIYASKNNSFTLTPGKSSYTWGLDPLADFNSLRPDLVSHAYFMSNQIKNEFGKVEAEYFNTLSNQPGQTGFPYIFYYNPTFPLGTMNIYPPPDANYEVEFLTFQKIPRVEYADDDLIMPDGYARAVTYNLALEIAPEFGMQPSALLIKSATESLANVKRMNIRPAISQTEIPYLQIGNGTFDISKG